MMFHSLTYLWHIYFNLWFGVVTFTKKQMVINHEEHVEQGNHTHDFSPLHARRKGVKHVISLTPGPRLAIILYEDQSNNHEEPVEQEKCVHNSPPLPASSKGATQVLSFTTGLRLVIAPVNTNPNPSKIDDVDGLK